MLPVRTCDMSKEPKKEQTALHDARTDYRSMFHSRGDKGLECSKAMNGPLKPSQEACLDARCRGNHDGAENSDPAAKLKV